MTEQLMTEQLMTFISQFHFLRPFWLLMLIPCVAIIVLLWRQHRQQGNWQNVIAPELLQHLIHDKEQRIDRTPLRLLMAGWILATLALAGPSWEKQPTSVSKNEQPLVIAVDLSYYMLTADVKPNRMARARFKLQDLIRLQEGGEIALVSYAGSAHVVAPLTDDDRTLVNLVKALNPAIMPVQGNKPAEAVKLAKNLLAQGSSDDGEILLVTGTLSSSQQEQVNELLDGSNIRLSVLGVGTSQGAPIPLPEGGYLKDNEGSILVPRLNKEQLTKLARSHNGQYRDMTVSDSDLKALLPGNNLNDSFVLSEREFDQWHDAGYWLVLLLLPLALIGFRRGWLTAVIIAITLPVTPDAMAFEWQDLWQTQNQQGQKVLQDGDPARAAELFTDSNWKAQALFQNQQFEESANAFANTFTKSDNENSAYNQGNALAKAGKLPEALKAYDKALVKKPDFEDAKFNRDLVEQLLKQQKQQQQDQNKDQQKQDQEKQDQEKQDSDQQEKQEKQEQKDSEQQSSDEQSSDKESSDKESSDKENSEQKSSEDQQNSEQQSSDQSSQSEQQKQQEAEQKDQKEQKAQQAKPENEQETEQSEQQQVPVQQDDSASTPEKQAVESWLRTIPDDPGGLLRRKFLQQQQQRQQEQKQGSSW